MKPEDRIQIGVVGKPHGVRGGFYLDGCIDAAALIVGRELSIGAERHTVASRAGTAVRPILIVEGVSDRDRAADLRGEAVTLARGEMTPLGEGEWFADDLVGLSVRDRAGRELGRVSRMLNMPSVDVLEIEQISGGQILVPMVSDAIVSIDPTSALVVDAEFLDLG